MSKIYQLSIDDKDIGDLYHNERYAVKDAKHLATSIDEPVTVWQAQEDIDTVPVTVSKWTLYRMVGAQTP